MLIFMLDINVDIYVDIYAGFFLGVWLTVCHAMLLAELKYFICFQLIIIT